MTTTTKLALMRWVRSARATIRLQEFGDECWRSLQLVVFFVVAAFLFGAPTLPLDSLHAPATEERIDSSFVRPVTAIDANVLADPTKPVSATTFGVER
ncbi:MAG: hypothetical protein ABIU95_06900 [Burkholderiales bacterium]